MENEKDINQKLGELEEKIDRTYKSVEKMRKYFMWTLIISLAFILLPLIGLGFAVPKFLSTYSGYGNLLPGQ